MLFRLDLDSHPSDSLEPVGFLDLGELGKLEKDLENILAANLFDTLYEEARLLPIRQERTGEAIADVYAVGEWGDLFIFELKRSGAGSGALAQVLRYAADAGRFSYDKLNEWYLKSTGQFDADLASAHQAAFSLDEPLAHADFNRHQVLRVVGSAADDDLIDGVDYWKRRGVEIDFVPYRLYRIGSNLFFDSSVRL